MRKILLGAALSSALLASPASAQDNGLYIGGELGSLISSKSDQTYTPGATPGTTGRVSTEHELGFSGAVYAGYDFGRIRAEVEASHQSADVEEVDSSFSTGGGLISGKQAASGDVTVRSIMANATVDIGNLEGFTFFLGGGAGGAKVKVSDLSTSAGVDLLDDKSGDWLFAWQGTGGVRKALTSNLDAHVRYRYFSVDEAEMVGLAGRVVSADYSAHSVAVGLTLNF